MGVIVEFFIIIAGLVGVVAVIFKGAMKSSKEAVEAGERARAKREFTEKFIDKELEKKIIARIADNLQKEDIYKELESDAKEIFGDDYKKLFVIYPDLVSFGTISAGAYGNYWALLLLLSKHGKFISDRCISLGPPGEAEMNLKVSKIVQRNIRQFDPSFSLCKSCTPATLNMPVDCLLYRTIIPECDFNPPIETINVASYRI